MPIVMWVLKPIDDAPKIDRGIQSKQFSITQKICGKLVRVEITDGRQYIGIFVACDKSGSIIVNDALELVNLCPDHAF